MSVLSSPLSLLARRSRFITAEASLGSAADQLRFASTDVLPVVRDGTYVGVVSENSLLVALQQGAASGDSIAPYVTSWANLKNYDTGAEALKYFENHPGETVLIIVGDDLRPWGTISPTDLFPKPLNRLFPTSIGGMATPFGVYLAGDGVTAGPKWWGLVSMGAVLVLSISVCQILAYGVVTALGTRVHLSANAHDNTILVLGWLLFALLFRYSPIAEIHAAEHMTVHAIERGESLDPATVSRMPRVHPRCGTNIAVGISLFTFLSFGDFNLPNAVQPLQIVFALLITWYSWRRLGGFVQYWVTTRKPRPQALAMGIRSGNELIEKFATAHSTSPTTLRNILNSGLVQVLAGGWLMGLALYFFFRLIGRPDLLPLVSS